MNVHVRLLLILGVLVIIGCEPGIPTAKPASKPEKGAPEDPVIKTKLPHQIELKAIEKFWKVKIKSIRHSINDESAKDVGGKSEHNTHRYQLLLEFAETLSDAEADELRDCVRNGNLPFEFYYLDSENVVLRRDSTVSTMGVITGMKGDSIRLFFTVPEDENIVRIEAREAKRDRRRFGEKEKKDK
jgi:hypothetical protein